MLTSHYPTYRRSPSPPHRTVASATGDYHTNLSRAKPSRREWQTSSSLPTLSIATSLLFYASLLADIGLRLTDGLCVLVLG
jgi:hypothetical protein